MISSLSNILLEFHFHSHSSTIDLPSTISSSNNYSAIKSVFNESTTSQPNGMTVPFQTIAPHTSIFLVHPLSVSDTSLVKSSFLRSTPHDCVVAKNGSHSIKYGSFLCLQEPRWLNDELINYYMESLKLRDQILCCHSMKKRCHFFPPFFFAQLKTHGYAGVHRWSRHAPGKNLFTLDKIIFPVNVSGLHWVCVVAYMNQQVISCLDSLGCSQHGASENSHSMDLILSYLSAEYQRLYNRSMDTKSWKMMHDSRSPVQNNGYDCGVFTCLAADFISADKTLSYDQKDATNCRRYMALSILKS